MTIVDPAHAAALKQQAQLLVYRPGECSKPLKRAPQQPTAARSHVSDAQPLMWVWVVGAGTLLLRSSPARDHLELAAQVQPTSPRLCFVSRSGCQLQLAQGARDTARTTAAGLSQWLYGSWRVLWSLVPRQRQRQRPQPTAQRLIQCLRTAGAAAALATRLWRQLEVPRHTERDSAPDPTSVCIVPDRYSGV